MTQSIPSKRPQFEEIFNSKHLWALYKNEFEIVNQMKRIIEEKSKDNQFITSFIQNLIIIEIKSNITQIELKYKFIITNNLI
jgi:hypothetical protein